MKYVLLVIVALVAIWFVNKSDLKAEPANNSTRTGAEKADKMNHGADADPKQQQTRNGSSKVNPDGTPDVPGSGQNNDLKHPL
jgi:hypothetical protein